MKPINKPKDETKMALNRLYEALKRPRSPKLSEKALRRHRRATIKEMARDAGKARR